MPIDDRALGQIAMEQTIQASIAFTNAYAVIDQQARQLDALNDFATETGSQNQFTCGSVNFSQSGASGFPAVLQLLFSGSCSDDEVKQMRGTLKATYSGKLTTMGTVVSVEFIDFSYKGIRLEGRYSAVTNRTDNQGIQNFRKDLVEGKLVYEDGSQLQYDETTFSRLIEGNDTDFSSNGMAGLEDDVWEDNRTATMVSDNGDTYALTTQIKERRLAVCSKPVSGELRLASEALNGVATLNFGDGACDNKASIMYEGKESQVDF